MDPTPIYQNSDYTYTYPNSFIAYPIAFNSGCMALIFTPWESSIGMALAHGDRGHLNPSTGLNDSPGDIRYHMFGANGAGIFFDVLAVGF